MQNNTPPIMQGENFVGQELSNWHKKIKDKYFTVDYVTIGQKPSRREYMRINKKKNIRCKTIHTS